MELLGGVGFGNSTSPVGNFLNYFSLLSSLLLTRHSDPRGSLTSSLTALSKSSPAISPQFNSTEHPEDRAASEKIQHLEKLVDTFGSIFPDVNFFHDSTETPKEHPIFYIYHNKSDKYQYDYIVPINGTYNVTKDHLKPSKPFKLLIHGFMQDYQTHFPKDVKNAYLESSGDDYNIILMDWSDPSRTYRELPLAQQYRVSSGRISKVGGELAHFLKFLKKSKLMVPPKKNKWYGNLHIVGFSLGAHIAGNCGWRLAKQGHKVARITGLDPAGPNFSRKTSSTVKLDGEDADFVDIYHTNMGQLGTSESGGQKAVNFYPNGGSHQPGCPSTGRASSSNIFEGLSDLLGGSCNHAKASVYFAKSILKKDIMACRCASWVHFEGPCHTNCTQSIVFGEHCPTNSRGRYYLGQGYFDLEINEISKE